MQKTITAFSVFVVVAVAAFWWAARQPNLIDLQKQYLFTKTDEEKAQVIDNLERYYLKLSVPNSLRQLVDNDITTTLDTTKTDLATYGNVTIKDASVYKLESRLQDLLRLAAIARAREESQTLQEIIDHTTEIAKTVDTGTQNNYWLPFVEEVSRFSKDEAVSWLKAKRAEGRCRAYQDDLSKFIEAENYAALGLRHLQQTNDERLRLDIMQRLQYILYFHRSMYELSRALGQKLFSFAEKIKYHLRANGIIYHQAEALIRIGQNQAALPLYEKIISNAQKFRDIPSMPFFSINGLLGEGKVYLELGEFDKAINACHEVEKYDMDSKAKIRLRLLKADIYRSTANYEQAKNLLKDGMVLAETTKDTLNLILCLNSFGALFERLQEYDLALDYYHQAKSLFSVSSQNISARLSIINNIADVATARQDSALFEAVSREAKKLVNLADMPWQKAELQRNIGNMYKKTKQYNVAIRYFQEAASIYNRNGFLRLDLGTRIDLSDCWIGLSKFGEAKTLLAETASLAGEINYDERVIDAVGRRAKIEYLEGNITQAVEISNPLLSTIAAQSKQLKSPNFLISYHQKLYDLLKDAVIYELALRGQDSAFVRLANIKAYVLQNQLMSHRNNNHNPAAPRQRFNLNSIQANLKGKSLLIDYMVTGDTLYAFVLRPEGLKLFRKKIEMETLHKTVSAYKDSISRTIRVFQHYDAHQVDAHYAGTVALAEQLYDDLLGWRELELLLKQANLLFVIPDEFLYELPFSTLVTKSLPAQTFVANHSAVLTFPSAGFLQSNSVGTIKLNTKRVLISVDQRFPDAGKFVARIKALFPLAEEVGVNNSALMQDDVLAKLQEDYQIYIFVGHGAANTRYPDRGYIDLSVKTSNTPAPQIIRLTVADLKKIDWLGTEMVMLVGCETASGKLYRGTGISGLHQEFLLLGAQNVLGNLWEVEARHAIAQAENFLTSWAATLNVAQALQACQSKAIQELQASSYFKQPHPYFWGSYVISTVNTQ